MEASASALQRAPIRRSRVKHLSGQLLITGASDLWALMDAIRYLAREPTEERLLGWWWWRGKLQQVK